MIAHQSIDEKAMCVGEKDDDDDHDDNDDDDDDDDDDGDGDGDGDDDDCILMKKRCAIADICAKGDMGSIISLVMKRRCVIADKNVRTAVRDCS